METQKDGLRQPAFGTAEIGALAHLYRGEMYQSKIWRNRLDTTSNWAIVITGIALSVTFSNAEASPIPLLLVSWVVIVFLYFESRRYLYYDLFRVRVRVMEINFYGPMLRGQGINVDNDWNTLLAEDYSELRFHISLMEAIGRRIRRTYGWIFAVLLVCYLTKILVHPTPLASLSQLWERATIGPLPGQAALAVGFAFHCTWIAIALLTLKSQKAVGLPHWRTGPDPLLKIAGGTPAPH
ncbi:MAG: DUF2270 domain-containing protein [Rhodospirillales bacterium]|nr:DUF2270 domain-containing protein [Rhodospirillales bacterium]